MNNFFTLAHNDTQSLHKVRDLRSLSRARTGVIHTDHGDIHTPVFMPVGTNGTVKTLDQNDLLKLNAEIILGNTYHLHLRPGENLIAEFGGLHNFIRWNRPILTDSGGFQVFSLGKMREDDTNENTNKDNKKKILCDIDKKQGGLVHIDEDGVTFRSHIDGSAHRFTPESAIQIQHKIGADIIMAFDECTSDTADEKYTAEAMERTHQWALRSLAEHQKLQKKNNAYRQFLFGIIQGANHRRLREESARFIVAQNFDGIAIGGESIGYNMKATMDILDWVIPLIPEEKPRYAMGVGFSPADLFAVVERGVDMVDCVAPTRIARHGALFVHGKIDANHKIDITNAEFRNDKNPVDAQCTCSTCGTYSRAYIHHLFRTKELLGYRLATIHNIHFFLSLMREMREAIIADQFLELKKEWLEFSET